MNTLFMTSRFVSSGQFIRGLKMAQPGISLLKFCSEQLAGDLHNHLITLSAFNIVFSITAIVGNALMLIAFYKETSLHLPSKVLLRSLAASDLCIGIMEPLYVTYLMSLASERLTMCRHIVLVRSIAITISFAVSLLTITAISVDRLLALLLGLRYRQVVTLKRVNAVVVAIWAYPGVGLALWFHSHLIWKIFAASNILLCLIIAIYCYTRIFLRLRRHQTQIHDLENPQEQTNPANLSHETRYRKTVSTAMWVQLTLILCFLPYTLVAPFAYRSITREQPSSSSFLALQATVSLIFLNSSLNPLLCFWKIADIRRAIKDTILKRPSNVVFHSGSLERISQTGS